jgi:spermidine/putrescine transport system substrate-binding protein
MAHPRERWPGGMSRRDFLMRAAGMGLALPTLGALLEACSKPGGSTLPTGGASAIGTGGLVVPGGFYPLARQDKPVKWNIFSDNQPIASNLQPETGATLELYNWDQYIYKPVVQRFCKQYNCDYKITTFNNMEEAIGKMTSGQLTFDVFFPTVDYLGKLVTKKLLKPLNMDYIPNLKANCWPVYSNPYYDQEARYTVPYVVYTTGLGYRRDVISDSQLRAMSNPYDILWDPTYKNFTGVYDSYRDVLQMAMIRKGLKDLNTSDPAVIKAAGDDLLALAAATSPKVKTNVAYIGIATDALHVSQAWSGDMVAAWGYVNTANMATYKTLGYWYPSTRTGAVDNDTIVVPSGAKNPVLAHLFLNFMLDFKQSMDNFSWVGYQPPQNQADPNTMTTTNSIQGYPYVFPWMSDAVVRPEDFDKGYRSSELSPDVDQLWLTQWDLFNSGK